MRIALLGSGSWGTALAQVLADNEQDVVLWGKNSDICDEINNSHQNRKFFGEQKLNPKVKASTDTSVLNDCDIYVLTVPTTAIENVLEHVKEHAKRPFYIVNTAKGYHPLTFERMSEVIVRCLQGYPVIDVVSLIGPSLAEEVVERMLTTVNAVCCNEKSASLIQHLFSNDYLRVYTSTDVVGAEIGVAIKNVMAIASGVATGLGYGDNTRAALITRGLAEMTRYGVHCGGKVETYLGLCGLGDLIVTCTSTKSRNFQAGLRIGQDNSARNFLIENKKTVEGIKTAKTIYLHSKNIGVDMPIVSQIYRILYEEAIPSSCIIELMNRRLVSESKQS